MAKPRALRGPDLLGPGFDEAAFIAKAAAAAYADAGSRTGSLHGPVPSSDCAGRHRPGATFGRDSFAGAAFHNSRWDQSLDITGKRVGVTGAGSTAPQIVPAIVDQAASASLFQRTPQRITPALNNPFPEEQKQQFRANPRKMGELYEYLNDVFNNRFAPALVGANDEGLPKWPASARRILRTMFTIRNCAAA